MERESRNDFLFEIDSSGDKPKIDWSSRADVIVVASLIARALSRMRPQSGQLYLPRSGYKFLESSYRHTPPFVRILFPLFLCRCTLGYKNPAFPSRFSAPTRRVKAGFHAIYDQLERAETGLWLYGYGCRIEPSKTGDEKDSEIRRR